MDICDLGVVGYEEALRFQMKVLNKRIKKEIPDTLIVLEHYPVVTLGRLSEEESIIDRPFFEERGIPVIRTRRGGYLTYHAPGQLVMYPVMDLSEKRRDIAFFIDFLEKTVMASLNELGVPATRFRHKRGVWSRGKKIAFIGLALKRWVTFHGVAININNDVTPFSHMHPCGRCDIRVTSTRHLTGQELDMTAVKKVFSDRFIEDMDFEYGGLRIATEEKV